jgi:predicted nuclease of predicted toxin-antitoxin system
MNLLADESVDRPIVERLRVDGHEVVYVAELSPSISDNEVLQKATDSRALLLTADKDFGELVFRQRALHTGVVLMRLFGFPAAMKAATVAKVFQDHGAELLDAFSVVSPGVVRIRHEP